MLQELQELKEQKDKVVQAKAENPTKWTKASQDKLDKLVEAIVDLEEQIELADPDETAGQETPTETEGEKPQETPAEAKEEGYSPEEGTEKMVHLKICHGRRFNPNTGKEEATPKTQLFSYGEFQLFKQNYSRLGYTVVEVLHDPTGEAQELVCK